MVQRGILLQIVISAVRRSHLDGLPREIVYGKRSGVDLVGTAAIFVQAVDYLKLSVEIKSKSCVDDS